MKNLTKLILFFSVLTIINACNSDKKAEKLQPVEDIISQVKKTYVPDTRDNIFDINPVLFGDKFVVKGGTSHPKVKAAIDSLMKAKQLVFIDSIDFLPNNSVRDKPLAIITLSAANLRKRGSLSTELISQVLMGQTVKLFKKEGSWYLVQTPDGYYGWIHKFAMVLKTSKEIAVWKKTEKLVFTEIYGHIFEKPIANRQIVADIVIGGILEIIEQDGEFYHVALADGRKGFVETDKAQKYENWLSEINATPENIIRTAKQFLGVPYMWGGTSAKFLDCSGFTQTTYKLNGIQLQRDASQQINMGIEIDTANHFSQLQAGDLLFFGRKATETTKEKATHVGIYLGDTEFIHEAGLVKINSLDPTRGNFNESRLKSFLRVKRILE